ncbi:MAG: hypothetical protein ACRAVC_18970 [Trichormus sp.]
MIESQSIIFFIDRCLGKKTIAEKLRSAGIAIEIHDDHFVQDAKDEEWLPEVGKRGWVVLTKDGKISRNSLERIAVAGAHIKMFALASQGLSGDNMATIFLESIPLIQEFVRKHPAPFIAKVYRDKRISLWKDSQTLLEELQQFLD